jgi:DNA-binding NarL/FixJ family response regulator
VRPVRVLVVDDQEVYRRAMVAVVEVTDGFELVAAVATGEEALRSAGAALVDLVLLDVNLSDVNGSTIDGIEASRRLREAACAPAVVLLSTAGQADEVVRGCGATCFIAKEDFGPDELEAAWALARAGAAGEPRRPGPARD